MRRGMDPFQNFPVMAVAGEIHLDCALCELLHVVEVLRQSEQMLNLRLQPFIRTDRLCPGSAAKAAVHTHPSSMPALLRPYQRSR
jgi:hypothetical protein